MGQDTQLSEPRTPPSAPARGGGREPQTQSRTPRPALRQVPAPRTAWPRRGSAGGLQTGERVEARTSMAASRRRGWPPGPRRDRPHAACPSQSPRGGRGRGEPSAPLGFGRSAPWQFTQASRSPPLARQPSLRPFAGQARGRAPSPGPAPQPLVLGVPTSMPAPGRALARPPPSSPLAGHCAVWWCSLGIAPRRNRPPIIHRLCSHMSSGFRTSWPCVPLQGALPPRERGLPGGSGRRRLSADSPQRGTGWAESCHSARAGEVQEGAAGRGEEGEMSA